MLPADLLYRKDVFAVRGSFRPSNFGECRYVRKRSKMFLNETEGKPEDTVILLKLLFLISKASGNLDERDFLDRVDVLAKLGYTVMISNFSEYYRLVDYFTSYNVRYTGIAMGVNNLLMVFDEDYYKHLSGGILEAFGKFFKKI